jgi:hypothetical protein
MLCAAICALVLVLLTLAACGTLPETLPAPDVVVVDEEEFNKRGAELKANRQRSNSIRRLWRL